MINGLLLNLYKRQESVFTLKDIAVMFPEIDYNNLKAQMAYGAKIGGIKKLRKNIYVKEGFEPKELANKLYAPSYISLETVLQKAGAVFQYDTRIHSVAYLSREVIVGEVKLVYRKINQEILIHSTGIIKNGVVTEAEKERAFLDAVYIYKNYHFDNLWGFDWEKIMEWKKIYGSKVFNRRIEEYYQMYKDEHA